MTLTPTQRKIYYIIDKLQEDYILILFLNTKLVSQKNAEKTTPKRTRVKKKMIWNFQ